MTELHCDWLDDYLGNDLPPECRAEFELHVETCASCCKAIDEWQSLSRLLKTATEKWETPGTKLRARIDSEVQNRETKSRRTSRSLAGGALVAACVMFIALVRLVSPPAPSIIAVPSTSLVTTTFVPSADLTFSDDVIGVPIDIGDPNVTVVWLYSTNPPQNASN